MEDGVALFDPLSADRLLLGCCRRVAPPLHAPGEWSSPRCTPAYYFSPWPCAQVCSRERRLRRALDHKRLRIDVLLRREACADHVGPNDWVCLHQPLVDASSVCEEGREGCSEPGEHGGQGGPTSRQDAREASVCVGILHGELPAVLRDLIGAWKPTHNCGHTWLAPRAGGQGGELGVHGGGCVVHRVERHRDRGGRGGGGEGEAVGRVLDDRVEPPRETKYWVKVH